MDLEVCFLQRCENAGSRHLMEHPSNDFNRGVLKTILRTVEKRNESFSYAMGSIRSIPLHFLPVRMGGEELTLGTRLYEHNLTTVYRDAADFYVYYNGIYYRFSLYF